MQVSASIYTYNQAPDTKRAKRTGLRMTPTENKPNADK